GQERLHVVVREAAAGGGDGLEGHVDQSGGAGHVGGRRRGVRQRRQRARDADVAGVEVALRDVVVDRHLRDDQRDVFSARLLAEETVREALALALLDRRGALQVGEGERRLAVAAVEGAEQREEG